LPPLFVYANQINAPLPYGALGPATLRVTTPDGFAETPVVVSGVAPVVLMASGGGVWVPALVRAASGALLSDAAPARRGDWLAICAVGLGELNRGGAPDFAGLYQVNVQLPDGLRGGSHTPVVVVGAPGSVPVSFPIASLPGL
jgi:hypothetical protein